MELGTSIEGEIEGKSEIKSRASFLYPPSQHHAKNASYSP